MGMATNDLARADAGKIQIERTGFYANDETINKVLALQFSRAYDNARRDAAGGLRGQEPWPRPQQGGDEGARAGRRDRRQEGGQGLDGPARQLLRDELHRRCRELPRHRRGTDPRRRRGEGPHSGRPGRFPRGLAGARVRHQGRGHRRGRVQARPEEAEDQGRPGQAAEPCGSRRPARPGRSRT